MAMKALTAPPTAATINPSKTRVSNGLFAVVDSINMAANGICVPTNAIS